MLGVLGVLGVLGGCEFGEVSLGFGDAQFKALPVALFAPWASSDDMALAVVLDFDEAARVADVSRMTMWRGVPWVLVATARMIWGRS
ncbi:MAG: hypothetical protein EBY32_20305 [Proteobacteria bacterium]|nr:hypothetical protein [Pseudomonadota bacterium]